MNSDAPDRPTSDPSRAVAPAEARNRDFQRLRGLQMLLENVAGASITALAQKYQLAEADLAALRSKDPERRDTALTEFETRLWRDLAPMIFAVYEAQLKMGSLEAARDLGFSLGLLRKPVTQSKVIQQPALVAPKVPAIATLDDYKLARQTRAYRNRNIQLDGDEAP